MRIIHALIGGSHTSDDHGARAGARSRGAPDVEAAPGVSPLGQLALHVQPCRQRRRARCARPDGIARLRAAGSGLDRRAADGAGRQRRQGARAPRRLRRRGDDRDVAAGRRERGIMAMPRVGLVARSCSTTGTTIAASCSSTCACSTCRCPRSTARPRTRGTRSQAGDRVVAWMRSAWKTLLETLTVTVRDVSLPGQPVEPTEDEFTSDTQLVFPYRGVFVRHVGGDEAVAEANQVLFFNAGEAYRSATRCRGGMPAWTSASARRSCASWRRRRCCATVPGSRSRSSACASIRGRRSWSRCCGTACCAASPSRWRPRAWR